MKKKLICVLVAAVLLSAWCFQTFAAGDVSTAIENTWKAAQTQIKNVVNNVVFPVIDMILAILFFGYNLIQFRLPSKKPAWHEHRCVCFRL